MSRRPLDKRTKQFLRGLFQGKVCVISDVSHGVDWHHLDEDNENSSAANIVPIARRFNRTLEQYRQAVSAEPFIPVQEPLLTPSNLMIRARHWFRSGQAGRAYGASRQATWLLIRYRRLFPADDPPVSSLCVSLSALRHGGRIELLDDVLSRDAEWIVTEGSLSLEQRARILVELAAVYQDVMFLDGSYVKRAAELLGDAQRLLDRCAAPPLELEAKVLRRRAISEMFSGASRAAVEGKLRAAGELELESGQWVGMENAKAWLDLAYGNPKGTLERLLKIQPRMFGKDGLPKSLIVAPWDAMETLMAMATARSAVDGRRHAEATIAHLADLAKDPALAHLRLRPIGVRLAVTVDGKVDERMGEVAGRLSDRSAPKASSWDLIRNLARRLGGLTSQTRTLY